MFIMNKYISTMADGPSWQHPHCGWIVCCCCQCNHTSACPQAVVSCPTSCWYTVPGKSGKCWHARRFGSTPLLHIGASFRRGRARPRPGRGRFHVGGTGGGGSWCVCWQETFWLGMWWLSPQPPPLQLCPSHPSRIWTLRPASFRAAGPGRPSYQSRIRVESLSCLRTLPRSNSPLPSTFKFIIAWFASGSSHGSWSRLSFPVASSSASQFHWLKFMIASRSESLNSRVFGPFALRLVGSWQRCLPAACSGLACPACRQCRVPPAPTQSGLDNVSCASRR